MDKFKAVETWVIMDLLDGTVDMQVDSGAYPWTHKSQEMRQWKSEKEAWEQVRKLDQFGAMRLAVIPFSIIAAAETEQENRADK